MKRKFSVMLVVAALALAIAIPAQAITFGQLDEGRHPNVGALGYMWKNVPYIDCSGTLIAPDVFLTAAHCVTWLADYDLDASDLWVSFDEAPETAGATRLAVESFAYDPLAWHDVADAHDIAVVLLAQPVTGITPAVLPPAGLLDQMKADQTLKDQTFVTVGYGDVREDKTGGWHPIYWEGMRRFVEQGFFALNPGWLRLSMNPLLGDGGTCYGDSGGPHFLGQTNMVVALTVTGDTNCRATDVAYRLDIPSARNFLAQYVTLP